MISKYCHTKIWYIMVIVLMFLVNDCHGFILVNNTIDELVRLPSYCIQSEVLSIFSRRFNCMTKGSAAEEYAKLQYLSTTEYQRAHELLAHQYFVNTPNPYRRESCVDAEFEYIPLLPLHWIATAQNVTADCTYAALIEDIVTYIKWLKQKEDLETIQSRKRPRFSVASTFNLRTAMGTGMPTPHRRGDVYDMVTLFVTTLSIGHYERWPQCPDLLRKSWKYVMELPYIPLHHAHTILASLEESERTRKISFLFTGRLQLFGPERVCSVRNALTSIADMPGVTIVEVTEADSQQAPYPQIFKLMYSSIFCFISKADSYSTASFSSAVHAGCIPVVISDWFVFSSPWAIPYSEFVIRILEEDFLKNPQQVVEHLQAKFITTGLYKTLQAEMSKWIPFISYEFVPLQDQRYPIMRQSIFRELAGKPSTVNEKLRGYTEKFAPIASTNKVESNDRSYVVIPFELMLLELRYAQKPESMHKTVPCAGPFKCTWNGASLADVAINFKRLKLPDTRTHLCKHSPRLIGHYKIVYYMQCVRILWPLSPGKLTKPDAPSATASVSKEAILLGAPAVRDETLKYTQLDGEDLEFVLNFHALTNISKAGRWEWSTYPHFPQEKHVKRLRDFVVY